MSERWYFEQSMDGGGNPIPGSYLIFGPDGSDSEFEIAEVYREHHAKIIVEAEAQRDELLAALKDVTTQYPLIHPGPDPAWIRNARAAIKSAETGNRG